MWLVIVIALVALTTWCICVASSKADDKAETMFRQDEDDENSEE